ncbi:MAG TPA: hypothetical protein VMC79_08270 [Rectinemataceae bacterium]|nr:hypothetical protein [Rectinemataceae bacterium]
MQVKNPEVFSVIESIGDHYRTNISNRFTHRALSSMSLDPGTWNLIEELTEKSENYRYQGYHFDELYGQILAAARFIYQAKRQVLPNLRYLAGGASAGSQGVESDRVFREMAINNFGPNLKILADKLNELYVKVAALDKDAAGQKAPVYTTIPELREIGRYLIE